MYYHVQKLLTITHLDILATSWPGTTKEQSWGLEGYRYLYVNLWRPTFSLRKLLSSTWQSSLLLHWMKVEMNPNIYLLDPRKEAKSTRAPHSPQMVWMIKSLMVMDLSGFHRLTLSSSRFLSRANPAAWRGESSYRRETVPAYGIERSRRYEDRQWLVNR